MKDVFYAILFVIGLIAGTIVLAWATHARAVEPTAEGFRLTPQEQARCAAGGGCLIIPLDAMEAELAKWLQKAFDAGKAEGCKGV